VGVRLEVRRPQPGQQLLHDREQLERTSGLSEGEGRLGRLDETLLDALERGGECRSGVGSLAPCRECLVEPALCAEDGGPPGRIHGEVLGVVGLCYVLVDLEERTRGVEVAAV
jgi:hypothetical protein